MHFSEEVVATPWEGRWPPRYDSAGKRVPSGIYRQEALAVHTCEQLVGIARRWDDIVRNSGRDIYVIRGMDYLQDRNESLQESLDRARQGGDADNFRPEILQYLETVDEHVDAVMATEPAWLSSTLPDIRVTGEWKRNRDGRYDILHDEKFEDDANDLLISGIARRRRKGGPVRIRGNGIHLRHIVINDEERLLIKQKSVTIFYARPE